MGTFKHNYSFQRNIISITDKNSFNFYPLLAVGIIGVSFGIFIYYLLPLAFLTGSYSLILIVVFVDFMGFFFGLSLVALNLQQLL